MSAYPNQFQYRYMHTWLYQHKGILWNKLHSTQDVTEFLFKYSSSSVLLSKRSKSLRTKSNSHMSLYFSLYKTKKQYGYTFFLTSKLLVFFSFIIELTALSHVQLFPFVVWWLQIARGHLGQQFGYQHSQLLTTQWSPRNWHYFVSLHCQDIFLQLFPAQMVYTYLFINMKRLKSSCSVKTQ